MIRTVVHLALALLVSVMVSQGALAKPSPSNGAALDNKYAVALVIGNRGYVNNRIPAVEYAHNDAAAMTRYLIDVLGYRKDNIIDLRDATQAQMEAALGNSRTHEGKLWQWIRPGKSDVTVFYSGHGVPGLKDKRGYLLPVNADPEKPEINGYPVDILYDNLAKLKAKSVTVYLDACFSGDSGGGILIRGASGLVVTPKLPKSTGGMTVLTAAKADQVASWDEKSKHGLFTHHLLNALYGKADGDADGRVSLNEVKTYLDDEMTYAARRAYGRKQTASLQGDLTTVLGAVPKTPRPKVAVVSPAKDQVASLIPAPVQTSIDPLDETYVITKRANVRAAPDAKAQRVTTLSADVGLQATGRTSDGKWVRVAHQGKDAFIFHSLVKPIDGGELSAWDKVKSSKRKSDFEGFLSVHPRGHFAPRAKRLMAALTLPKQAAPTPNVQPAVGTYLRPGKVFRDCGDCPEMVVIPSGSFRMGDLSGAGDDDEKPVHQVTIPKPFAVGKFEVTQAEWRAVMGTNPSQFQGDRNPVEKVSWDDAQAFIRKLSNQTGKQYRLLSEAEWEYAARAGTGTKYHCGSSDGCLGSVAWFYGNSGSRTHAVGGKGGNAFGLHDMHGNVWEWVEDCWNKTYAGAPMGGTAWTSGDCSQRVLRGGSWYNDPTSLRSAFRFRFFTVYRISYFGFRVARTL